MNRTEVAALLTKMAAYDKRTIGKADVEAWHEVLPDEIGLADALSLVPKHFATKREQMMPVDVIEAVTAIRKERLQRAGTPPMPGDLTWQQEKDWRRLWCGHVKDGLSIEAAAQQASRSLNLPLELEPATSETVAEERKALVAKLAESKTTPKAKPENFKPKPKKPRTRWGQWSRGDYVQEDGDTQGHVVFHPDGERLWHDGGPYGIAVDSLIDDPKFWLHHIAGKGWGDSNTLTNLARAWAHITNANDDQYATAIVWVSEALSDQGEARDDDPADTQAARP